MTDRLSLKTLRIDDTSYETQYTRKFENRRTYSAPDPWKIRCVIPGVVQKIHVSPGKKVVQGEPLMVLEAMKMANDILAPRDGCVKAVHVSAGTMVTKGEPLIDLE